MFKFLKSLRNSARKSKAIGAVGHKLARASLPTSDIHLMMEQAALREEGIEELVGIIVGDEVLSAVMAKYGATPEDIKNIYRSISVSGGAQYVKGHWVPASALAFGVTLDYILRQYRLNWSSDECMEVAYEMISYFESGKLGRVDT